LKSAAASVLLPLLSIVSTEYLTSVIPSAGLVSALVVNSGSIVTSAIAAVRPDHRSVGLLRGLAKYLAWRLLTLASALLLSINLRSLANYLGRLLSSLPSARRLLLLEDLRLRSLLDLTLLSLPASATSLRLLLLLLSLPASAPGLRRLLPHLKLRLGPRSLLTHLWRSSALRSAAAAAISAAAAVTVSAATSSAMASALCVRGAVRTC